MQRAHDAAALQLQPTGALFSTSTPDGLLELDARAMAVIRAIAPRDGAHAAQRMTPYAGLAVDLAKA
jgi:hypothetical protein